jgi:membrane protein
MNFVFIAAVIVIVTFFGIYGECARKTETNQEVSALRENLLKGCLVSLVLLLLPFFGSLLFPQFQPRLATITFIVELAAVALFGFRELRKRNHRMTKLVYLLVQLFGIALVWCQLFSYYKMDQTIFSNMDFVFVPLMAWLATITIVVYTYLDGPKLRPKKLSKTEAENVKLREQIERMQNQQNKLQQDNEKLRSVVQGTKSGTTEQKSVTEDKKAESNLPKNTQAEEESTTKVEEAQTTTSASKSDAEDKPRVEVTNPSMTEVQQQKLSEILNRLSSDSSPEAQQRAVEEIVKNYRAATAKEAPAPEEEISSQEPEFVGFEEESDEEEEEGLDSVDGDENWEDDTIFTDLFAKINPVTIALVLGIIIVFYGIIRVVL